MATNYNEVKQELIKEFGLIPGFFGEDKEAPAIFLNKGNPNASVWMDGEGLFFMDDVAWEELSITNALNDDDTPLMLRRHGNWVHITGALRAVQNQKVLTRITTDIAPNRDSYFSASAFLDGNPNLPVAATILVKQDGTISSYLPQDKVRYLSFSLSYPIK